MKKCSVFFFCLRLNLICDEVMQKREHSYTHHLQYDFCTFYCVNNICRVCQCTHCKQSCSPDATACSLQQCLPHKERFQFHMNLRKTHSNHGLGAPLIVDTALFHAHTHSLCIYFKFYCTQSSYKCTQMIYHIAIDDMLAWTCENKFARSAFIYIILILTELN